MLHHKTLYIIFNLFFMIFFVFSADQKKLLIKKENKVINFFIEVSKTKEERSKGLMYRTKLSKNKGMLFIFPSEEYIKMWMKNTLIPLDIIFISKDKEIVEIKHNMKKLSHSIITSKIKSKYALEINAGLINKLNIEIGDRVYFNE